MTRCQFTLLSVPIVLHAMQTHQSLMPQDRISVHFSLAKTMVLLLDGFKDDKSTVRPFATFGQTGDLKDLPCSHSQTQ